MAFARKAALMSRRVLGILFVSLSILSIGGSVHAGPAACTNRANNTVAKLLECVTVEGVRAHQAAFQAIADANGGNRVSGTPGYDQSVSYVAGLMEAAGYEVTIQPFEFVTFGQFSPPTLEKTAPGAITYTALVDFQVMTQSDSGDVTAPVTA